MPPLPPTVARQSGIPLLLLLLLLICMLLLLLDTTQAYLSKLPLHSASKGGNNKRLLFTPGILMYVDDQDLLEVTLPSMKQVSTDSFTDQTFYASTLVAELLNTTAETAGSTSTSSNELLQDLMTAQLSHQDGIRGFLAVYLTRVVSPADDDEMPIQLVQAMKGVDMTKLAPLACMNVIRPVAMACWHSDPTLKSNSAKTAERAKKFLASLQGSINIVKNCQAIYAVACGSVTASIAAAAAAAAEAEKKKKDGGSSSSSSSIRNTNHLELFWEDIFQESAYDEEQRKAIAAAFASFVHP